MSVLKNNKGFSLIELMIAVVIIGVLAAIAIPNYQKYQRKSRQAEAKSTLAAMFTSEKSYIAEYGAGSSSLKAIGYLPEGRILYNCGWDAASGARAARDISSDAANVTVANTVEAITTGMAPDAQDGTNDIGAGVASPAGAVVPAAANFTIACEGNLGMPVTDQWTMDQGKQLIMAQDGT